MGNTHDTEIARIEADYIHTKWRTTEDYRWGYSDDRGLNIYEAIYNLHWIWITVKVY